MWENTESGVRRSAVAANCTRWPLQSAPKPPAVARDSPGPPDAHSQTASSCPFRNQPLSQLHPRWFQGPRKAAFHPRVSVFSGRTQLVQPWLGTASSRVPAEGHRVRHDGQHGVQTSGRAHRPWSPGCDFLAMISGCQGLVMLAL